MASELEKETREALLTKIKTYAADPSIGTKGVEQLAQAFALTVGAKWGHLPGELDASS